jgi:hypothetical protein
MGPVNPSEMFVMTFLLLISSVLNSIVFGEIAMIVSSLQRKDNEYQQMLDKGNDVMSTLKLPIQVQKDFNEYFNKTIITRNSQKELDDLLDLLSPSFKTRLQNNMFTEMLKLNPIIATITKQKLTDKREKRNGRLKKISTSISRILINFRNNV